MKQSATKTVLAMRCGIALTAWLVASAATPAAAAVTTVWNGGTGNWSTGTNWSAGVPGPNDTASFTNSTVSCSISSSVTVAAVIINRGVTITVASGNTFTVSGAFNQSAGVFNAGNSTVQIGTVPTGGDLLLSGGTFNSTSGLLKLAGAFNKSGGTFNANGGTVMLASSTDQAFTTGTTQFNNLTINDGLLAYFPLEETSSPSLDYSGYGLNATWTGSPTSSTTVPTGITFADTRSMFFGPGATDDAEFTSQAANTITVSAWIYQSSEYAGDTYPRIVDFPGYEFMIHPSTDVRSGDTTRSLQFTSARSTVSGTWQTATNTVALNTWYHVAATYDSSSTANAPIIYINGVASTVSTLTTPSGTQTSNAGTGYIGNYNGIRVFGGYIDDLRVYNRVLSASEINSLYIGNQPGTSVATQTLSGSPTVSGDLTIASGELAIGTYTLSVAGSWRNYGGVFTPTYGSSGGTVAFTGAGTSNTILAAGQLFPQVNITGSGTWTLAGPMDVDPARTVSLTAGQLNGSSKTLRGTIVGSGGTFTPSTGTVVADSSTAATMAAATYNNLRIEDPTETNLVGYWKLDEGQGGSTHDWTGAGRAATLVGGSKWTSTVPGAAKVEYYDPYAMSFDGSTSYLDVTSVPTATNSSYTACAWVYYKNLTGNQTVISAAGPNAGSVGAFYLQKKGLSAGITNFTMGVFNSDSTGSAAGWTTGTVNVQLNTWYHVCGIYTGSVARLYVNGAQDGTDQTIGGGSFVATGHTYIGGAIYGGTHQDWTNGLIDDVRFYSGVLSAAQVKQLANGRYANTGGVATFQLGGNLSASGTFDVDSGVLAPNAHTLTANSSLTIRNGGTLSLSSSADVVGVSGTLTVDGTLIASNSLATIQGVSGGNYAFTVGSTTTATPTLNLNGLTVTRTDANGMSINANTSAVTTFTRFDSVAFKDGTSGSGSTLLKIYAPTLYLASNGCSFDANLTASTTYAVTLTGNGTGSGAGPRALFGSATCASNSSGICATTEKSDDDSGSDGVADHPSTNGAVVQFVRAAAYTAGTLVGHPTAAFDWNTFIYYSTYAAFHNASGGTNDMVYVLDQSGAAIASWTDTTAGETITGTPQWVTPVSGGTHYLYVSVNGSSSNTGKVYRLIDTGTGSAGRLTVDSSWATSGAYSCTCTITSGLSMDATNLYWAATTASAQVLAGIKQSNGAVIGAGWPVTTPFNVTTSSPTLVTQSGTTTLYLGVTADLLSLAVTGTSFVQNSKPGTITGRVAFGTSLASGTSGTQRIYAGDSAGKMWAISPSNFAGANWLWSYAAGSAITGNSYDSFTDTVQFGTAGGKIVVLTGAGSGTAGVTYNTTYPVTLDASDPITAAPLYYSGVLVVGTTKGKLYLLDRHTGLTSPNGVSTIATYSFGPTESVSTIAFDPDYSRYMVSTSSAASDGRIYYFDLVADPTPTFK